MKLKSFFINNIFLVLIILFVIIHVILNYEKVILGEFTNTNIIKSILITGILYLIVYLWITWEDDNYDNEEITIPKYKLGLNEHIINPIIGNKYKIINDNNENNIEIVPNNSTTIKNIANQDKLSNPNIFISHKNAGKYGIKF